MRTARILAAIFFPAIIFFGPRVAAQMSSPANGQVAGKITGPIIGQITGDDISVIGDAQSVPGTAGFRTIEFAGGSTVVVHTGKARIQFAGGEQMDVCGPAKFTVLASGQALTIALSFGRVHVKADALRPIAIYTPTVIATPVAIGEQPRDMTLGISDAGAMCLLAARGAVQVQQQLSGEMMMVPQPSELYLQAGSSQTTAAPAGSCNCDFDEAGAKMTTSESVYAQRDARNSRSPERRNITSEPALTSGGGSKEKIEAGSARRPASDSLRTVAHSGPLEAPAPTDKSIAAGSGASTVAPKHVAGSKTQVAEIANLPSEYSTEAGLTSAEPISEATLLLAREEVVEPGWIFEGVVSPAEEKRPHGLHQQKKHSGERQKSFWARFRAWFLGH